MKMPSDIRREDEQTFWVNKSEKPNEEYMVWMNDDGEWSCECTDYWVHLPERGKPMIHKCKHVIRCILLMMSE